MFNSTLIEDPDTLREKVEQQAQRERRELRNTDREARALRGRLEKLEIMEDGYSEQQAEGLLSMERLREKLATINQEREDLKKRLAELADGEEKIRRLEELPSLVEAYLRDLPVLMGRTTVVRDYETVPEARTEDNPLGDHTLTPECIRHLSEAGVFAKHRAAVEERSQRFRELYAMLGLRVVCPKDSSLEITWGGDCSEWLGRE